MNKNLYLGIMFVLLGFAAFDVGAVTSQSYTPSLTPRGIKGLLLINLSGVISFVLSLMVFKGKISQKTGACILVLLLSIVIGTICVGGGIGTYLK